MLPRQANRPAQNLLARFVRDDDGATAIEYGLLAAMIAAFLVTALLSLSSAESNMYAKWTDAANSAMESP